MDFVAPEADCRAGKGVQNNWHAVFFTDFEDIGGKQNILALVKILSRRTIAFGFDSATDFTRSINGSRHNFLFVIQIKSDIQIIIQNRL